MKAVYIRTSTEEQEPETQIREIETISGKEYTLFKDKQSAWKDNKERNEFESLRKEIENKKINDLYVWDLDRIFRNRKRLLAFFEFCKMYKCMIHSYRQQWLEQLITMPEPFNEMMYGFMLHMMGWIAEEESDKKSERVKKAVIRSSGTTKSYKGNKWGRKEINKSVINQILNLRGKPIREISKLVYYYDKNNNKKNVSPSFVHKIITKYKGEKDSNEIVPQLSN